MSKQVAVVLSGCGVFDGSEIHEAVSILIALDQRKAQVTCFAPDVPQRVVNHHLRTEEAQQRQVLVESARIARGKIRDIASAEVEDLDAAIFPGGFGAAWNLCTFASDGANCKVEPAVQQFILAMHAAKKPLGFACIAPAVAAAVLGRAGVRPTLTIGTDAGTAATIEAMGAQHHNRAPTDICIDQANKIVSTPCYMTASGPWEVYQGAEKLVEAVLAMC